MSSVTPRSQDLIAPHGGTLCERYLGGQELAEERGRAADYPAWTLTERQLCDLELLLSGGFSPLVGYLNEADYQGVVHDMRLTSGLVWPMPINLDVPEGFAEGLSPGQRITLKDREGCSIAVLAVEDIYRPDRHVEAEQVFGSTDDKHPGVAYLLHQTHPVYLGGTLYGLTPPVHYDFRELRRTPAQLREHFARHGWQRVVAFQTRNPMHRAHQELTYRAARIADAHLLIQPVVGLTKPGDIDYLTRVRCYQQLLQRYPADTTMLSLLPLAMRMGGPREALWHAIIRKNHGCTHFIVGRDHAGPGKNRQGEDFYGPYDAQELVAQFGDELGIEMVPFQMMVFVEEQQQYVPADETTDNDTVLSISGTEFRRRLRAGEDIPEWFSYPEVVAELRRSYPPRHQQGFTVFFTGLSGSGKSTIANALMVKLMQHGGRNVTLLDGDVIRTHLSNELGFSREHRDINVRRIGFVASEITKHRGIAICAPIAPYAQTRRQVRELVEANGGFVEVHVATPLEVCEARDRKGLYAKARAGEIKEFTGISDPYEVPENPEITLDTREYTPDEAADQVLAALREQGYL